MSQNLTQIQKIQIEQTRMDTIIQMRRKEMIRLKKNPMTDINDLKMFISKHRIKGMKEANTGVFWQMINK